MSKAWAKGSTRQWRKIRAYVLHRDNWICGLCGLHIPRDLRHPHPQSATVHHRLGKRHGDDPAHLEAAHRKCNLDAGDPRSADPTPTPRTRW